MTWRETSPMEEWDRFVKSCPVDRRALGSQPRSARLSASQVRAVGDLLRREGLVRPRFRPRRAASHPGHVPIRRREPNELETADFEPSSPLEPLSRPFRSFRCPHESPKIRKATAHEVRSAFSRAARTPSPCLLRAGAQPGLRG